MNQIKKQNRIVTILGKKGNGKSFFTKSIIPYLEKPIYILDVLGEYENGIIFRSAMELVKYKVIGKPNNTGIYILRPNNDEDVEKFFMFLYNFSGINIIAEESSIYCNPYFISENFKKILNYGRHKNINLIAIARRASEVHRDITAQSDFIISFRQTEKRDLKNLEMIEEKALNIKDLKPYEFMILGETDKEFEEILKKIKRKPKNT